MSRRSDRFKKILPTDVPRRGLDVAVSTRGVETGRIDATQPNLSNRPRSAPNFSLTMQGDSIGNTMPRSKKSKTPRRIKSTDFRIRLDFTIRVEGDDVIPEIFGPNYMDFIAAGLRGTMLKAPKYKDRNVDVLPGSKLHVSVKQHKEK